MKPNPLCNTLPEIPDYYKHWTAIGIVLRDPDTGNVAILNQKKPMETRLMVVSEFDELMNPTKPCVQLGLQQLAAKLAADSNLSH